jgi:hypothetical protein
VKGVLTALLIVAIFFGIFQLFQAASGWLQMSTVVDDVAAREIPAIVARIEQPTSIFEDRYGKIREGILKGAREAGVNLPPEGVAVSVESDVLNVRLSWKAPMITYQGKTYLDVPMTMQRGFSLGRPR